MHTYCQYPIGSLVRGASGTAVGDSAEPLTRSESLHLGVKMLSDCRGSQHIDRREQDTALQATKHLEYDVSTARSHVIVLQDSCSFNHSAAIVPWPWSYQKNRQLSGHLGRISRARVLSRSKDLTHELDACGPVHHDSITKQDATATALRPSRQQLMPLPSLYQCFECISL